MNMRHSRTGPLGALALGALLLGASGCSDTDLKGVLLDDDLSTDETMLALIRGSNSEVTDVWAVTGYVSFQGIHGATDDIVDDGTAAAEQRSVVSDYSDRPQGDVWGQSHEAAWGGYKAADRMREVFDEARFESEPMVARAYINAGWGERFLGETFCELVYNYGIDGGFQLTGDGNYDDSRTVPKDSAFTRMAGTMERGLEVAQAALAAGKPATDGDSLFDPQRLVYMAHGGAAQAYAALAGLGVDPAENWARAVSHAQEVPIAFVHSDVHDDLVEENEIWDTTWDNDDFTVWGAVVDGEVIGTPATALWPDDPRVDVTRCGEFEDPNSGPGGAIVDNNTCDRFSRDHIAEHGRQGRTDEQIPAWNLNKYDSENSDIQMVTGTEMLLIRAEAALFNGDLGSFTSLVNQVREFHGADPISQPASVGSLEWPNAEDDALSILDRERYLEMWVENRRYFDLHRWEHPFVTNNEVLLPRLANLVPAGGRNSCVPIPDNECQLNEQLACPAL